MSYNFAGIRTAIDRLVMVSPGLLAAWKEEWGPEASIDEMWVEAGAIGRYIIRLVGSEPESHELEAIAQMIEELFAERDIAGLDNWLQIGLIEGIQNITSNTRRRGEQQVTAAEVKAHLGPRSQASWEALDRSWGNSVDDI